MIYSAADLAKRSCMQIVYFRETGKEKPVSQNMLDGVSFQEAVVDHEAIESEVYTEMRGCYNYNNNYVFFCIDMIKDGVFTEIKSVRENEDWYFKSAVLQCVIYKTLLMNMDGNTLVTPKFRLDEGFEDISINVDKNAPFHLMYGNIALYNIEVTDEKKMLKYIQDKVDALKNYTTAKAFDEIYKHNEFDLLKDCFEYTEI